MDTTGSSSPRDSVAENARGSATPSRRGRNERRRAARDAARLVPPQVDALEARRFLSAAGAAAAPQPFAGAATVAPAKSQEKVPKDGKGGSSNPSASPAVGVVSNDVLTVTGTTGDDAIALSTNGSVTTVSLNGNSDDFDNETFASIVVNAGNGADSIVVGDGVIGASLNGGAGNDTLRGGQGADTINGGGGSDTVDYSGRTEDLEILLDGAVGAGGLSTSGANGGAEGDVIFNVQHALGGSGNDEIKGNGPTPYTLDGGAGNDTLLGGDGDDALNGGAGNDTLDGKGGADVYNGGRGFDAADYRFRGENLTLKIDGLADSGANGGAEGDTINLDVERLVSGGGNDAIAGSDADNSIDAGGGNDTVNAGPGDDSIDGGAGNDSLLGDGGADVLTGGPGADTMLGGDADDTFVAADGAADVLNGGPGTDTALSADRSLDTFVGVEGGPDLPQPGVGVTLSDGTPLVDNFSTVDFGTVVPNGAGPTRTFIIQNTGDAPLTLGQVQVPFGFTLVDAPAASLAPGATTTFTVRLDSTVLGSKSGQLSFSTNVGNFNPFNFTLRGTVAAAPAPALALSRGRISITTGATVPIDFGTAGQGQAGPTLTFTIQNNGNATLLPGAITLPAGYTLVSAPAASVAPGGTDTFVVRLDTAAPGVKSGNITFASNDARNNPFVFAVTGAVVAPEITVLQGTTVLVSNAASPIDFGNVVQGNAGPTRVFTVRNDGTDLLTLAGLSLPAGFTLVSPLSAAALAAGRSATFTVGLDSSSVGDFGGAITLANNDATESPFVIPVAGSVVAAAVPSATLFQVRGTQQVAVANGSPTPVNYGTALLGSAGAGATFRVTNTGTAALALGRLTLPAGYTLVTAPAPSVPRGGSTDFVVRLDASAAGNKTGPASLATNDPTANPYVFTLAGVVAVPAPVVSLGVVGRHSVAAVGNGAPRSVNFGTTVRGSAGIRVTFSVRNSGTAALRVGHMVLPAGFRLVSDFPAKIAVGRSATFTLRLDSRVSGVKGGAVQIRTNDPRANPFTYVVGGSVVDPPPVEGVSADLAGGVLTVVGTPGDDAIVFGSARGGVTVTAGGAAVGGSPFAGVGKIVVDAGAGDDTVSLGGLSVNGTLNGEDGNDALTGGNGNDVLNGGEGDDVLLGGSGNDVLNGGGGNDALTGGFGVDALNGESGNDALNAADGVADSFLDGGAGTDKVSKDRLDPWTGT